METNPIEAPASAAVSPRRRRWWWFFAAILALAASLWASRFWLGARLADSMRAELASRGFHASWDSAAYLPGNGISFKAFELHRDAGQAKSLMKWDQVTLSRGLTGWASLHLHAKGSELILGDRDENLRMEELEMELHADREGVHLKKWRGLVNGIRVDVTGEVSFSKIDSLREKVANKEGAPAVPARKGLEGVDFTFLGTVGKWITARSMGDEPVRMVVRIKENDAQPGYLLTADLDGVDFVWRGQRLPALGITMNWALTGKPEPIFVSRLTTAPEKKGQKMALVVDWNQREVKLKAESVVLHLVPVLAAVSPSLTDSLNMISAPQASSWHVEGVVPWGRKERARLVGQVATSGGIGLKSTEGRLLEVTNLQTAFDLNDKTLVLKEMKGGLWGGQVQIAEAQVNLTTNAWRVKKSQIQGIQIPEVTRSLSWKKGYTGVIDGSWHGAGGGGLESLNVQGFLLMAGVNVPLPTADDPRQPPSGERQVEFTQIKTEFEIRDQTLLLQNMAGRLWGGQMAVTKAQVNLKSAKWGVMGARVQAIQIPLARRGFGLPVGQQGGVLEGSWEGEGGLELKSLTGRGSLRVTDAAFYQLLLLGPLHLIFDRVAPGFGKDTISRMETNHELRGGILTLKDLKVHSTVTEIQAEGDLNLATQRAKLTARAKLRGIVGLPTALLGRLLTLDGEGPFSDVEWRLRFAPGLEQVTGVTGAVGDAVLTVGGGAVRVGVGTAAGALKGAGKAAKGVLSIPGRFLKKEVK